MKLINEVKNNSMKLINEVKNNSVKLKTIQWS